MVHYAVRMDLVVWKSIKLVLIISLLLIAISADGSVGIGCYICHSFNNSNSLCEDPFMTDTEEAAGYYTSNNSETLMIRTCSLDSGTLTADTEIVRMSHCGHFKYNRKEYSGCVQSCALNGCNTAPPSHYKAVNFGLFILAGVYSIAVMVIRN